MIIFTVSFIRDFYIWWVRGGRLVESQLSQLVSIFRLFSREFCECKQVYKMIKIWRQVFFVTWFDRSVSFPNCNRKWRITNKKCSWQEFKHYLVLGLAFQVFESRSLHGVLIGILRFPYLLCEYYLVVRLMWILHEDWMSAQVFWNANRQICR